MAIVLEERDLDLLVEESADELGINREHLAYVKEQLERIREHHQETYEHSVRVGRRAIEILRFVQESSEFSTHVDPKIGFYGMLHDRGKTEIPVSVIDAKNFGSREKEIMDEHPIKGYEILMADGYPYTACLALTHHLWENPAYPEVLPQTYHNLNGKRDFVRGHARLISIADHSDAMRRANQKYTKGGFDFRTSEGRKAFMMQKDADKSALVERLYTAGILD